jgi:hypothetical protein
MDLVRELLETLKREGGADKNLLGLLHVCIGRRVASADGSLVSTGVTWRDLAGLLKKLRWPTEAVRQLGLDPETLPPRDRQRFWYAAISQANVGSPQAIAAGDRVAQLLRKLGYQVGEAPGGKSA